MESQSLGRSLALCLLRRGRSWPCCLSGVGSTLPWDCECDFYTRGDRLRSLVQGCMDCRRLRLQCRQPSRNRTLCEIRPIIVRHYSLSHLNDSIPITRSLSHWHACRLSGQKWPLFFNLVVLSALQIATAFVPMYSAFIGVRALFGIFMGGIWGLSAALTLKNMLAEARGLFFGLLQQSYALGYLIAAGVNLGAVPSTKVGYQIISFVGAGFTALIAIFALLIPESHIYHDNKHITNTKSRYAGVWKDLKFASHSFTGNGPLLRAPDHGLQLDEPRCPRCLPELHQSAKGTRKQRRQHRDYDRPVRRRGGRFHLQVLFTVPWPSAYDCIGVLLWTCRDSTLNSTLGFQRTSSRRVLPSRRIEWRVGRHACLAQRVHAAEISGLVSWYCLSAW